MELVLLSTTGLSVSTALGIVAYKAIRPRFPVTVNCWFCNQNTRVPYGNKECWDCPHCDQYNGFSLDGDYNKAIPSQYYECLNHPITAENKPPSPKSDASPKVLCDLCSSNQVLKLRQLADFVPDREETYDIEVENYRRFLENAYGLCGKCDRAVVETVSKQDRGLVRKIEQHHRQSDQCHDVSASDSFQTSMSSGLVYAPLHVRLLRYLVCLCFVALFAASSFNLLHQSDVYNIQLPEGWWALGHLQYLHSHALVLILPTFFMHVLAIYLAGRDSLSGADAGGALCGVCLLLLFCERITKLMHYTRLFMLQGGLALLAVFIALWCAFIPRSEQSSPRRIVKRRCNGNTSGVSSTTGTPNHSPEPSLAGERQRIRDDNLLDLDELETLSVGSPYKSNTNYIRAFGQFGDTRKFSAPPAAHSPSFNALGQPRPVLSPARFHPPLRSNHVSTTSRVQAFSSRPQVRFHMEPAQSYRSLASLRGQNAVSFGLLSQSQGNRVEDDRASLFSEPREPTVIGTNSSCSASEPQESSCPVDTTVPDNKESTHSRSVFGPVRARRHCSRYTFCAWSLVVVLLAVATSYIVTTGRWVDLAEQAKNWTHMF